MSLTSPYYRIIRPMYAGYFGHEHLIDPRYCQERNSLIHGFQILLGDFRKLCDYIEPDERNNHTFSHRTYELFFRACTEFENNCKGILKANGYQRPGNWNITDYYKINAASRLSEYVVKLDIWSPEPLLITPFHDWASSSSLTWYQDYNKVKHDRSLNFNLASLENLIKVISAVLVILISQFNYGVFSPYQKQAFMTMDLEDGFKSGLDNFFSVKYPTSWTTNDNYQFDWNILKSTSNPYTEYQFI